MKSIKRPEICIIGAGISGLVCGRRLASLGFSVTLVEQNSVPGGMLSTIHLGKHDIELIPHHLRRQDKSALDLFSELGLHEELEWFDAYWYGRVRKRKLGYPKTGFHVLLHALEDEIKTLGGNILCGYTVMDIQSLKSNQKNSRYQISCVLSNRKTVMLESDIVLFTAACRNFAHITNNLRLPRDYQDPLMDVTYQGNICLLLQTKKSCSECYSKPFRTNAPFQKIIEHTNIAGAENYGGHVLYLTGVMQPTDPLWIKSDAELFDVFFRHLQKIMPSLSKKEILNWRFTRTRYALPTAVSDIDLFQVNPGLFLCTLAMVGIKGTDAEEFRMNSCIAKAIEICDRIDQMYRG